MCFKGSADRKYNDLKLIRIIHLSNRDNSKNLLGFAVSIRCSLLPNQLKLCIYPKNYRLSHIVLN